MSGFIRPISTQGEIKMTETHKNGREDQKQVSGEAKENAKKPLPESENDTDIIELSDIAIGITQEDDVIVELTEDLIGEAFDGFTGATSEVLHEDEHLMDLSHARQDMEGSADGAGGQEDGDVVAEDENPDEDISRELDNFFGTEGDVPSIKKPAPTDSQTTEPAVQARPQRTSETVRPDEIRISSGQLDDAIERVIRKMFAEKINRILDDVIERTVSEEISQLRDYLLGVSGKK